jgi:aldehyde dehydrogenase (NAD+)
MEAEMADIASIISRQRQFYYLGHTRDISFRLNQLKILQRAVIEKENQILEALYADLKKSPYEAYLTEAGLVREEIRFYIKHLAKWARPRRVKTPFYHLPSSSYIYPEPYGVVLIISPWNYPYQLAFTPLVAAIAAGNCAVIKPSEFSAHTSEVLAGIVKSCFDPGFVSVVTGGVETSSALLKEKFDSIFFTGSTNVGKIVMSAASNHLTPVTLELGGKSPCIVESDADIKLAAKRIVSGKFINAGQTCIAPDYILVKQSVKDELIAGIKNYIELFFGKDPKNSKEYPRIISRNHFDRLVRLTQGASVVCGGDFDPSQLYFAPTLLTDVDWTHPVMQEEIFGPILPVIEYNWLTDAILTIKEHPKPLALYVFTGNSDTAEMVLKQISFGGGCVNDTLVHFANPYIPFGGVGASGMGSYHGKPGFDAFTHYKGVMKSSFLMDFPFRYPPFFRHVNLLKKVIR